MVGQFSALHPELAQFREALVALLGEKCFVNEVTTAETCSQHSIATGQIAGSKAVIVPICGSAAVTIVSALIIDALGGNLC